jgi:hypothetical protein
MPQHAKLGWALLALLLAACSHGGGGDNDSAPRTNIDLTVTDFSVTPSESDPEDLLTISGTIRNLGTEMANPMQGDSFVLMFNLSLSGAFQFNEQGFFQKQITDPIPAGGALPFSYTAPYGNGDTLLFFGNFCSSIGSGCVSPQPGVIGVSVDATDQIKELNETNNFQFLPHGVVGTRVAVTMASCDSNASGCDLKVFDNHDTVTFHRPCIGGGCTATEVALPNELNRTIRVTLQIVNCTNPPCGWGVTVTAVTQKDGLPINQIQVLEQCLANAVSPLTSCAFSIEIRDPNY